MCVFRGPAMPRAVPRSWCIHRQAQVGSGPLVWGGHLETLLGPGTEPGRKVSLTPSAGVRVGRQRGPVSSVWERVAATMGHEIGSSGAPQQGPCGYSGLGAGPEVTAAPPRARRECGSDR